MEDDAAVVTILDHSIFDLCRHDHDWAIRFSLSL